MISHVRKASLYFILVPSYPPSPTAGIFLHLYIFLASIAQFYLTALGARVFIATCAVYPCNMPSSPKITEKW
jgi:hypothetical protein